MNLHEVCLLSIILLYYNQYPLLFDDILPEIKILLGFLFQHKSLKWRDVVVLQCRFNWHTNNELNPVWW